MSKETTEKSRVKYRKKYPERVAEQTLRSHMKRYGITINGYNELFSKQGGKCAICGIHQSELKKSLDVDHCHKTDIVRGLLCNKCNTALGLFQDDIQNLKCAILYLNKKD